MTRLYDLCKQVSEELEQTHAGNPMALIRAKGEIATRVGFLVGMVGPHDFDDPDKITRLQAAVRDIGIHA
ncbi:MAG: hypothetical protein WBI63_04350 [Coriobacteriia bacterium]